MHRVHVEAVKNLNAVVANNMMILLRRIPANTKKGHVVDFIDPFLKGGILQKPGRIENIKILVLKSDEMNGIEYHGIVTIDSDVVAKRLIKKLNGKAIKGKHIVVREYHHRLWQNDPRVNIQEWSEESATTRTANRRRSILKKEGNTSVEFSSLESFHRKL